MATSQAVSAQGTYISLGDGASPEVFLELAEVSMIGGPKEKADEIDVTHLRSTGGYREFIQSFKDGGDIPLTLNFIPGDVSQGSVSGLRSLFQSGAIRNFKITYPDTSTCSFTAWVKEMGNSAKVGDKLELDATLRMVGASTWVEV